MNRSVKEASSPRPSPPREERETLCTVSRFMVPMHATGRKEALHEQPHRFRATADKTEKASSPRPSPPREERETLCTVSGFMVPMHAAGRKEAFHEPKQFPLTPAISPT